jgi:hypothetical protein
MTETIPATPDESGGSSYPSDPACDPKLLDRLKCKAEGVQAQADYAKAQADGLKKARDDYEQARIDYRAAREKAKPTAKDLGKQLEKVLDQLRCLIDDRDTVRCLDEAFDYVQYEIQDKCGDPGFQVPDCDFSDLADCDDDDVTTTITRIVDRIAAAKKVFDDLVAEPKKLAERAQSLKKEVDDIVAAMASDSRSVNFEELYVKARVAEVHHAALWRGIDSGHEYVELLCAALLCQVEGHAPSGSSRTARRCWPAGRKPRWRGARSCATRPPSP